MSELEKMIKKVSFKQRVIYAISFIYGTVLPHRKKKRRHWNWVTEQVILGALPIKSKFLTHGAHHIKITKEAKEQRKPLGLVVSLVRSFEQKGQGLPLKPVSFLDWQELNVETLHLPIPDFSANTSYTNVFRVIKKMRGAVESQRAVYIHCKAGRGRSWMILMCYLTVIEGFSFEAAEVLIKCKRAHVSPSEKQKDFVLGFKNWYKRDKKSKD